jgi:hypothetical protein
METSCSLYFKIDDFIPKGKKYSFGELVKKFSEETSLQPDPTFLPEFYVKSSELIKKPDTCLAVILACSYIRPGYSCAELFERLLDQIYHNARCHNFEGRWSRVGEVLQQDLFSKGIYGILSIVIQEMSLEDLFGNFLPKVYSVVEHGIIVRNYANIFRDNLSRRERLKGVRRKIRRRGYNDKGSRRLSHEHHETGYDYSYQIEDDKIKELRTKYAPPRRPRPRYFYRTLNYGVGPNG